MADNIKELLDIEDRLKVIKYLFELQIQEGFQAEFIFINQLHQKWEKSTNFRASALELAIIQYDSLIVQRKLQNLLSLSDFIIDLWDTLREKKFADSMMIYCTPIGGREGYPFEDIHLIRKRKDGKTRNKIREYGNTFLDKNRWWSTISDVEEERYLKYINSFQSISGNEEPQTTMTLNISLLSFVGQIYRFLKNEALIDITNDQSENQIDYSALLNELKPYFGDCSESDIKMIVDSKRLPDGRKKIRWEKSKADAIRFIDYFGIKIPQFNQMFDFKDEKKLRRNNADKNDTESDLTCILQKYPK